MNEQSENRNLGHRWQPGQSGNPAGRPTGTRNKLSEAALTNMLESWAKHGPDVLERVAKDDPGTYLRVVASIIPKDVAISVEQRGPGGVDPDQWQLLRGVLDAIERSGVEAEPALIFDEIEHALRARFAKPISA